MQNNTVDLATLAKLFNLSERRIQQLAREGVIPRVRTGEYDVIGAIRGYLKSLQPEHNDQVSSNYQRAKTRLINLQADQVTLRLARDQTKLLSAIDVDNTWSDRILCARAILQGLPPRLSAQISALCQVDSPHAITRIIAQGINEALDELARPITYKDNEIGEFDEAEDAADNEIDDDEAQHWD